MEIDIFHTKKLNLDVIIENQVSCSVFLLKWCGSKTKLIPIKNFQKTKITFTPSTTIVWNVAYLCLSVLASWYSSESSHCFAFSKLSNSRITIRFGCQCPSRFSALQPQSDIFASIVGHSWWSKSFVFLISFWIINYYFTY